jgi:[acyl-carrier-protein] S-malonyltransferase
MADTAIVFAGQGAQTVGMAKDLAERYPDCLALFEKADEVLGYGLSGICFEGPEEELTKSNHCQPAIFVASTACYKALCLVGKEPAAVGAAGLSLGEWSALHMAGALSFEDTLRVLEARGRFMQEACEERDGAMVSLIGLSLEQCREICDKTGVQIANLNSSAQTVLSGERAGIEQAETLAKEAGAKRAVVLRVAGAFHSRLMDSAAERLAAVLAEVDIREPSVPVIANVTGMPHGSPDEIRETMVKQVNSSVRWLSCIEWFRANGAARYIECGPGKVLTGLIRRIHSDAALHNVYDVASLEGTLDGIGGGA